MSNLDNLYSKYHKKSNAIVMGNGPSLNNYNFDLLKEKFNDDVIFLSCNRVSNFFDEKKIDWRPDIYTCFTSLSLTNKAWQVSIDRCLKDKSIFSFVFNEYKNKTKLNNFHDNIFFCKSVIEHDRHQKISNNFIDIPLETGFLKSYSATVTLFQICNWLGVENIFIVGQDGYTKNKGDNHFSNSYNFEPNNFEKSNKRILLLHKELYRYFTSKNVNVFNSSKNSILNEIYGYKNLNLL